MLKVILCNKSVPRVEIDQRVRDARLQLEQIKRLLVPHAPCRQTLRGWRAIRTRGPLNNQRPSMPEIYPGWILSAP